MTPEVKKPTILRARTALKTTNGEKLMKKIEDNENKRIKWTTSEEDIAEKLKQYSFTILNLDTLPRVDTSVTVR